MRKRNFLETRDFLKEMPPPPSPEPSNKLHSPETPRNARKHHRSTILESWNFDFQEKLATPLRVTPLGIA